MAMDNPLGQRVEKLLQSTAAVDADGVVVTDEDGSVTLTGHVSSYHAKDGVERVARGFPGVRGVRNNIKVYEPGANRLSDADLVCSALGAIKRSSHVPSGKVIPRARDGWLILEGEVEAPYQRQAAEDAVKHLNGIRGLSNNIIIESQIMAQRVGQRILDVFVHNAHLRAGRISVSAHDHKVILSGYAESANESKEAESAAWQVPGVAVVVNRIRAVT